MRNPAKSVIVEGNMYNYESLIAFSPDDIPFDEFTEGKLADILERLYYLFTIKE